MITKSLGKSADDADYTNKQVDIHTYTLTYTYTYHIHIQILIIHMYIQTCTCNEYICLSYVEVIILTFSLYIGPCGAGDAHEEERPGVGA